MDSASTVLYNPFMLENRIHFPKFIDAFGDLLKIEAENLKKINDLHGEKEKAKKQKERTSKPKQTKYSNQNKLKNRTIKSTKCTASKSKIYCQAVTPIPTQKSKKKNFMFSNPKKANPNSQNPVLSPSDLPITPIIANEVEPHTENKYAKWSKPFGSKFSAKNSSKMMSTRLCTPMPTKKKKKKKLAHNNQENLNMDANAANNPYVTPAPTKKTKTSLHPNFHDSLNENTSIIMMADILSPNPNNRCELSSPAPNDKNARLLTKTPAKFPICMPPTPMLQGSKRRNAMEEKSNNEWFKAHKPVLTPAKIRENPVKLYDPSKDMDTTIMLEQMDTPFDETEAFKSPSAAALPQLLCDISMIMPLSKENSKGKTKGFSKNFSDVCTVTAKKSKEASVEMEVEAGDMCLDFDNDSNMFAGNSFAFDLAAKMGKHGDNGRCRQSQSRQSAAMAEDGSLQMAEMGHLNQQFSDIKIQKTKRKMKRRLKNVHKFEEQKLQQVNVSPFVENERTEQEKEEDLLGVDVMSDAEFFSVSGMEQKSTQTAHVVVFDEWQIPKIRYDGRLMSECVDMESHLNENPNPNQDEDVIQMESDGVFAMFTPSLRHNKDSIECLDFASDSEAENKLSRSYNGKINAKKRKRNGGKMLRQNGGKMLRQYKQSKLAQNPNWTICNAHDNMGSLI